MENTIDVTTLNKLLTVLSGNELKLLMYFVANQGKKTKMAERLELLNLCKKTYYVCLCKLIRYGLIDRKGNITINLYIIGNIDHC